MLVSTAGCGHLLTKAAEKGIKDATHGSVDINGNKATFRDSNGNECTAKFGDTSNAVCVDSKGDTVASGKIDSNGATGKVVDSNGDTCSGSISGDSADTGAGKCVDSNGKTVVSGSQNGDSGSLVVNDSNGDSTTFTSGNGTKLPSGWPSELNPPSGANLAMSIKSGSTSEIEFTTKSGSVSDVFNTFDGHLTSAGWHQSGLATINGNKTAEYTKGSQTASLILESASGGVSGTVSIANS